MKKSAYRWYVWVMFAFALIIPFVLPIPIKNNLDKVIPQYEMLRNHSAFFKHNSYLPTLGSVPRDFFASELKIYTLFFVSFPTKLAYYLTYAFKIVLSLLGFVLVRKTFFPDKDKLNFPFALIGLIYGIINIIPTEGLSFAAIPFLLVLIKKIMEKPNFGYYVLLFLYPFLSGFFYFGILTILGILITFIVCLVRKKKAGFVILALIPIVLGYALSDYRLISSFKYDCFKLPELNATFDIAPDMDYAEYYSPRLFREIKEDIGYYGQWAMGYGIDSAVLNYNDIFTIDGDVPHFSLEDYEETFDILGDYTEGTIDIDTDLFKEYDGRFIFADCELDNAEESGFTYLGKYEDEYSPYNVYVYRTTSRFRDKERTEIPYDERMTISYDRDDLFATLEELEQMATAEEADECGRFDELIEKVIDDEALLSTLNSVAEINLYSDFTNEEYAAISDQYYEDTLDYSDEIGNMLCDVANSVYYDELCRYVDSAIVDSYKEYEEMTEEQKEREIKEKSLSDEYNEVMGEEFSYELNGQVLTVTEADYLYEHDLLSDEEYEEVYYGILDNQAQVAGDIYLQLLRLRDEEAQDEDYDNYADYAYEALYFRDYTVKDIKKLIKQLKGNVAYNIWKTRDESILGNSPGFITADDEATFRLIYDPICEIDPEMGYALKWLLDKNLYDLKPGEHKSNAGFTIPFKYFGDAYIFDSPYESATDMFTYVHEFGHFVHMFYEVDDGMFGYSNPDLNEINSQGLEMLFSDKYKDIFDDEDTAEYFEYMGVFRMLDNLVYMAYLSEFEIYAYEHPNVTYDKLCDVYVELGAKYGYDISEDEKNEWVFVPHFFTQPCYSVSYLTSGLTSLELYVMNEENSEEAFEKYMMIQAYPSEYPYRAAMDYAGMTDIFEKRNAKSIINKACAILNRH